MYRRSSRRSVATLSTRVVNEFRLQRVKEGLDVRVVLRIPLRRTLQDAEGVQRLAQRHGRGFTAPITVKDHPGGGDLALVRDSEVRSAILGYVSQLRADLEEFRRNVQLQLDAETRLDIQGEVGSALQEPSGALRMFVHTWRSWPTPCPGGRLRG